MFRSIPIILVRGGSVLLILTAFLFLYLGFPFVSKGLFAANIDEAVSGELKAVWVGFCLHLFFIAYLLLVSSRRRHSHESIVVLGGLVVLADSILVRIFFANTFGAQLLGLSGIGILLGSFFWILFDRGIPAPAPNKSLNPTPPIS
jgi:hypothetical protein